MHTLYEDLEDFEFSDDPVVARLLRSEFGQPGRDPMRRLFGPPAAGEFNDYDEDIDHDDDGGDFDFDEEEFDRYA